ncbi:MAG: hypothetical protein H0V68_11845 [Actinobacteria bacterium]|nr:hypothetical protein [Actinomycetota bacterium]
MRAAFLIAGLLAAAVGCGSEPDAEPDPGPAPGDAATSELEITFWPQGRSSGNAQTWTLTCNPAAGTHPSPEDACAQLDALDQPFAPPAPDEICTEQYGGPEEALVEGTYRGEPVSFELSRTNGCEIGRWEQHSFLLPDSGRA